LTVEYILNLLAHGATSAEILAEYDGITQEDIRACLLFAARALENTTFMPLVAERAPAPNPDGLADGIKV
jgi:hypothetical protein